jgi:hypothetical protein
MFLFFYSSREKKEAGSKTEQKKRAKKNEQKRTDQNKKKQIEHSADIPHYSEKRRKEKRF